MSDPDREQLALLFRAFFPNQAERWEYLLARDPSRWEKMAPFRHWFTLAQDESRPPKLDLAHPALRDRLNDEVVALSCLWGGQCWIRRLTLAQAWQQVGEGYISILPGTLGLALNHEGGRWLLQR